MGLQASNREISLFLILFYVSTDPSRFSTWPRVTETNGEPIEGVSEFRATFDRRGNSWKTKLWPKPVGRIAKTWFLQAKFSRQVFCCFLISFMFGKSHRQSSYAVDNMDSSTLRALFVVVNHHCD